MAPLSSHRTRQKPLRRQAAIVGVGATRQGRHEGVSEYRLAVEALQEALADSGLDKNRIGGVLTNRQFDGSGIDPLELSKLVGINPRITHFLDYGTGGFTTQHAAMLVSSGLCDAVACVFARNPKGATVGLSGAIAFDSTYGLINAGGMGAMGWTQHMARFGSDETGLGRVAVAARKHAQLNPNAAFTDPLSLDDYLAEEFLVWPFRELDICKVTAGGVAILITTPAIAASLQKQPVLLEAAGRQQAMRTLEAPDHLLMHRSMRSVAEQLYEAAGIGPGEIDVLAVSDATTAAVLQTLEGYGFCEEGAGPDFAAAGGIELGGALPTNTDGGQLSGGYLVGWLHQVELTRQLRGECGARQVPGARVAQYCTTGRFRQDYLSTIYTTE